MGNIRGLERIRTAVQGFADLCLTTRPRDHFESANILFLDKSVL